MVRLLQILHGNIEKFRGRHPDSFITNKVVFFICYIQAHTNVGYSYILVLSF